MLPNVSGKPEEFILIFTFIEKAIPMWDLRHCLRKVPLGFTDEAMYPYFIFLFLSSLEIVFRSHKLNMIREQIPDIILRTTVLVGFPGETEEDFEELLSNLKKWKFDRLGCFAYSPEEDTPAFDMPDQVDEDVKKERVKRVYEAQYPISEASSQKRVGSEVTVTIDSVADDGIFYVGRSYGEAPDDDPVIYVAASDGELEIGGRYRVKIVENRDSFDMTGVSL